MVKDETGFDYDNMPDMPDWEDDWEYLFERDPQEDVYELVRSLRDNRD